MWRWLAVAAMVAVPACDSITGCDEEVETVEIDYRSGLEELQRVHLQILRDNGFDCESDGSIRNAFGQVIGIRYRCTKCS